MRFLLPGGETEEALRPLGEWRPCREPTGDREDQAQAHAPLSVAPTSTALSHTPLLVTGQHPAFSLPDQKWGGRFPSHSGSQAPPRNGLESTHSLVPALRVETNQSLLLLLSS